MRKCKTLLWVTLTLAALVLFALAPRILSGILDSRTLGKTSLKPMQSLELTLHKDLSALSKLAMVSKMESTIHVTDSKAQMTRDQVMEAVYNGLRPYLDAGIVTYTENTVELEPYLIQVSGYPELQRVVWIVMIHGSPDDFTFFDLIVDDETGKILRISYTTERGMTDWPAAEVLLIFEQIYLAQFDLFNYPENLETDYAEKYTGDNGLSSCYVFRTEDYGDISVDLCVYDYGFYVEFPGVTIDRFTEYWAGPYG